MALVTNKPGYSDDDTKIYYELNEKILEKRRELDQLKETDKLKRRKLEDEINQLLLEQVMITQKISI